MVKSFIQSWMVMVKNHNNISLLLIVFISLYLFSCGAEKEIPTGFTLLDRVNKGEVRDLTLYPAPDGEAYFCVEPSVPNLSTLLFGNDGDYQTRTLMKFTSRPDTSTVQSAKLILHPVKYFGDGNNLPIKVYKTSLDWNEAEANWSDLWGKFEPDEVGSFDVTLKDTTAIIIDITPDVVNNWITEPETNFGLYLDTPDADFITQIYSTESAYDTIRAALEIVFTPDSVLDTTKIFPHDDVTLFNYKDWQCKGQLFRGAMKINNGAGYRSLIKFDFPDSVEWEKATIHHANLIMNSDTDSSDVDNSIGIHLGFNVITSENWDLTSLAIDSSGSLPTTIAYTDKQIEFTAESEIITFSKIVQEWTAGRVANNGLLIRSINEGTNLYFLKLISSKGDAAQMPRLEITYSLPASPRL